MSPRALPPPLIAITPASGGGAELVARARAAFDAGLRALVVREPSLSDRAYLELAARLREVFAPGAGGWLAVHDRAHLAHAGRADAVHLGWRSLAPAELGWLGAGTALGISTHAGDDVERWSAADYAFHGPVLETMHRPIDRAPIGFDGLARACASTPVPIFALGGLAPEHAREVAASGARGMAVMSGILGARDPAARAAEYVAAVRAAWPATL